MSKIAKVEGNTVVLYVVPGNRRDLKLSGWPDAEKVSSAVVTESSVAITFSNGKVRAYDPESGQLQGTY